MFGGLAADVQQKSEVGQFKTLVAMKLKLKIRRSLVGTDDFTCHEKVEFDTSPFRSMRASKKRNAHQLGDVSRQADAQT
jgi:hypothetical protein